MVIRLFFTKTVQMIGTMTSTETSEILFTKYIKIAAVVALYWYENLKEYSNE